MTVKELIEKLQKVDGDKTVVISTFHGGDAENFEANFVNEKSDDIERGDSQDDTWYFHNDEVCSRSEMNDGMEDPNWRTNPEEMKYIQPCVWLS